ncbi:2'-5' RNA ligase family protein [Gordonia sp. CPCC 205333]|uniref:2'-5' RNA ligase family protein n=1 Tax=Gordonia sp. CPCC 205333 TaxID=3140790 RepID=UPI003AF3C142
MTHSIELLLDDAVDRRIRGQWAAVANAGLPSQADVATETNRPHVTLLAAPVIDGGAPQVLGPVAMRLPITCRLGAVVVFGSGSHRTLARLVVPSADLLSVHATVVRLVTPLLPGGAVPHTAPGAWTPHVTIARRMTPDQISAALDSLDVDDAAITFTGLRHWDGDAKTERVLSGRDC